MINVEFYARVQRITPNTYTYLQIFNGAYPNQKPVVIKRSNGLTKIIHCNDVQRSQLVNRVLGLRILDIPLVTNLCYIKLKGFSQMEITIALLIMEDSEIYDNCICNWTVE